ncbi:hypothetical protein AB0A69_11255 [Streptomyces sp. NPDC045431]|uniref:hypothetical protein n=1 Tax=Streptomyces sp. NPDC045431 TaxID=3155613 RepID=UPI0034094E0E
MGSGAAVVVALAAFATGCGGGGSDTVAAKPPAADSSGAEAGTGAGSTPGKPTDGKVDFDTVFKTEERFKQALPDPASMAGWTPKNAGADIKESPKPAAECGADTHWDCTSVARGDANFEAFGEEALFDLVAYADKKAAQDACRKEKTWSAKYAKAEVAPVPGIESHAYYRNAGGLDGLNLTMCLGTVIAQVRLEGEGSSLDPATAHSMARMFVPRIQKAAAAS